MRRLTFIILSASLLAVAAPIAAAHAGDRPSRSDEAAASQNQERPKYVGNSGRLAPNSGVEREPSGAGKNESSADDPSLNAGIGGGGWRSEKRSQP